MGQSRLKLQSILEEILGTENVYFQPPPSIEMEYPCIIYKLDSSKVNFAGNALYMGTKRYLVTVIDLDPDSKIPDKILHLRYCSFVRYFAVDGLNHNVYTLYF